MTSTENSEPTTTILVVDHTDNPCTLKNSSTSDDCQDTVSTTTDADSTASFSANNPAMDDPDAKPSTAIVDNPDATKPTAAIAKETHVERQTISTQDHKGCQGVYTGRLLLGNDDNEQLIPDGHGIMEYANHPTVATYTGNWIRGAWTGQGQATLLNGDSYAGEHHHGERHGHGTYSWRDGRNYTGSFVHDARHGQGSYSWPCGASYFGAYDKGVRTGYGKYLDPTEGISYQGDWKDGVYHGYGVLTTTMVPEEEEGAPATTDLPKRVYRGNFVQGQAHGEGVELLEDGTIRHDGLWKEGTPVDKEGRPIAKVKAVATTPEFVVVQNETVQDANGLSGTYRGILHVPSHKPHGNGVLTYHKLQSTTSKKQQPQDQDQLDYYEGCFEMGCYHGRGRLHWKNGDQYDGDYVRGRREGEGTYKWADGRYYKGTFQDDQRHGVGKFVYGKGARADWYEGDFVEGRREGQGRFCFSDGATYQGSWKGGVYWGPGILTNADGSKYEGEFREGVAHGQGKEVAADGTTILYEGMWIQGDPQEEAERKSAAAKRQMAKESTLRQPRRDRDATTTKGGMPEPECEAVVDMEVQDAEGNKGQYTGLVLSDTRKPHGVGRMVYLDGRRIHEGFWVNGLKEGHGRCLFVEQGDWHEGEYKNNVRHGPGKYKWRDGREFVGSYANDLRNGKGVFTYPNGEQYDGNFVNGEKEGHGRFEFRGGFYVGEWVQGRYNGQGRLSIRGEELVGIFKDGEYVGKATCDVHGEGPASVVEETKMVERMESVELGSPSKEEEAVKEEEVAQVKEEAAPTTEKDEEEGNKDTEKDVDNADALK